MDRRELLKGLAGTAGALALAPGCVPRSDPEAVVLRGWAYEPDLVRSNLARYREMAPEVQVDYAPVSGNYHDKMVAQFVAKTDLDVVYVRDDHFGEWVEAGWLRPIQDLPGAMGYQADIFPFNWEAMTYGGGLYGLPYYSDFTTWVWNRRMLEQAGYTECGRTLDEIAEQCVRIRERKVEGPAGVVEYPLVLSFKQAMLGFADFWALMYGSEVDLFTDDYEPIFPDDPGRRAERVLQWMVDGVHKHRFIDLHASFSTTLVRDLFAAGRIAMMALPKYELQRLNDPKKSDTAGDAVMAPCPSLEAGQSGTLGWTRMYCLAANCRHVEKSWRVMDFLGGKDPRGEYSTARSWYLERGLGFAFQSMLDDREVIESTSRWGDIEKVREQAAVARPREIIKAPWYSEFDTFYQAEIQEILQGSVSPRDGLARVAAECRRLRRSWA